MRALSEGLHDLGYGDGRDYVVEWRAAEGRPEPLTALAAELVQLPVEVLVTVGVAATLAAAKVTTTTPIVQAAGAADLVQEGLATSLARPGGNVTGLTELAPELTSKRLDILQEALPGLQRVAILWNPDSRPASTAFQEAQVVAVALGVALRPLAVRTPEDLEDRVTTAAREPVDALLVLTDALTVFHQERIAALAGRARLPAMFDRRAFAVAGGLLAYGPDILDLYRRAATYVDKILKGAKPGDLPIERPTKFDFVINLKTAQAFGWTIPPSVLAQASEVIQ